MKYKFVSYFFFILLFLGNIVYGQKQLFKAIKKGDIAEVKQLINEGSDVNALNKKGYPPLYMALGCNRVPIMELLVENGADLFYQSETSGDLLGVAALNKYYCSAEYLLANGVDVNGAGPQRMTPLQCAAFVNDIKMMKILLKHGADVNWLSRYGENALWDIRSKQAFYLLYNAGIDLHIINSEGYSALLALWHEKFEGINEVLCTMFYEGAIFHEPDKDHHLYLNKNFHIPAGFDSLIILDRVYLILGTRYTNRETPKFKTVNDTFIIAQRENEYHVSINGGDLDDFKMEENEDVLSICISRFVKDNEKYNGITGKYFSPLPLEKENAWAHIKHKGDNYYAFLNINNNSGYVIIDDERCNKVKFFNLLLENPETGKKLRVYGENNCLEDEY